MKNFFKNAFAKVKNLFGKSKYSRKRRGITLLFTVIFLVMAIAANIFVSVLAERFPLNIDLNSDLKNTLSDENIEFLKTVDKQIKIYVIGNEDSYVDNVDYIAQNYSYTIDNSGYYQQTLNLIKEYPKHNHDNIEVKFLDDNGNEFNNLAKNYSNYTVGDLFVECTFEVDGKEITRRKLVSYSDMYYTASSSSGYYYTVKSSMLENALTSAIYSVMLDRTVKLGYFSDYSPSIEAFTSSISDLLSKNNYELVAIKGLDIKEIPEDIDGLLLYELNSDFNDETVTAISDFLTNEGALGKNLYYFPSYGTADRPKLNEFLEEWGISYYNESGVYSILYDKELEQDDTSGIFKTYAEFKSLESMYTESSDGVNKALFGTNALAMEPTYETYFSRTATVVLQSYESFLKPSSAADSWKPASSDKAQSYASLIVTSENDAVDGTASCVVGFASSGFLCNDLLDSNVYSAYLKNTDVFLEILNETNGQSSAPFSFKSKTIESSVFIPSTALTTACQIIFMIVIPVGLVAVAIVTWVRRKNR